MTQQKNTPELWNHFWKGQTPANFQRMLANERTGIRWQRLRKLINAELGGFTGLKVIEIGAGTGTCAFLMAELGARVTILDYSAEALESSRNLFGARQISVSHLHCNALHLPKSIQNQFDIAMSFGLAEHFRGKERIQILQAHVDLIRPEGIAIISVPNALNPPYRLWKWLDEWRGRWPVGEEYPFTRRELHNFCRGLELRQYRFIGDSLISSFKLAYFLRPTRIWCRLCGRPWVEKRPVHPRPEWGTFLDAYLSYALVLCLKKERRR